MNSLVAVNEFKKSSGSLWVSYVYVVRVKTIWEMVKREEERDEKWCRRCFECFAFFNVFHCLSFQFAQLFLPFDGIFYCQPNPTDTTALLGRVKREGTHTHTHIVNAHGSCFMHLCNAYAQMVNIQISSICKWKKGRREFRSAKKEKKMEWSS